jgi:hypothetical protein
VGRTISARRFRATSTKSCVLLSETKIFSERCCCIEHAP